jgi:hypothetical protein
MTSGEKIDLWLADSDTLPKEDKIDIDNRFVRWVISRMILVSISDIENIQEAVEIPDNEYQQRLKCFSGAVNYFEDEVFLNNLSELGLNPEKFWKRYKNLIEKGKQIYDSCTKGH